MTENHPSIVNSHFKGISDFFEENRIILLKMIIIMVGMYHRSIIFSGFKMKNISKIIALLSIFSFLAACDGENDSQNMEVNIYSSRLPELTKPVFDAFEKETGIKVNSLFLGKGTVERLRQEKELTKADLVLVSDIGKLVDLKESDLTASVNDDILNNNISEEYRDKEGHWFGLTRRIRMIAYAPARISKDNIDGYAAFGDAAFKGRVCSRSGLHPYNVSMISAYEIDNGSQAAEIWLKQFKENLAVAPSGGDRDQVKLIAAGKCDIAPINHYYFAKMEADPAFADILKQVKLLPISDMKNGAYANISGAVISKYSDNQELALKLLQFMSSEKGQKIFSDVDYEVPVNKSVKIDNIFIGGSEENIKPISLTEIADKRESTLEKLYHIAFDEK